jgi:hypothetical protein
VLSLSGVFRWWKAEEKVIDANSLNKHWLFSMWSFGAGLLPPAGLGGEGRKRSGACSSTANRHGAAGDYLCGNGGAVEALLAGCGSEGESRCGMVGDAVFPSLAGRGRGRTAKRQAFFSVETQDFC